MVVIYQQFIDFCGASPKYFVCNCKNREEAQKKIKEYLREHKENKTDVDVQYYIEEK